MATEDQKPTTAETGETPAPATTPTDSSKEDAASTAPEAAGDEKASKPKKAAAKPKTATPAKGTTGASTTTADGTPAAKVIKSLAAATQQVLGDAAAGFTTVTGSDEDSSPKVYQGEEPMSAEDTYKASQGFDPLTVRVPDGQAYGNMGLPHVAKKSDAPIGPTGNVPTGAPHADLDTAAKLDAPLAKERKKALEE